MFNYIWADPSRDLPRHTYSFYNALDATGSGMDTEHPAQSTLSLASEGMTAPVLMHESSPKIDTPQNPANISNPFRRRWFLRRNQDGFVVEPVLKDCLQTPEDKKDLTAVISLPNEFDSRNEISAIDNAEAVIMHQRLYSTDGTLSCDATAVLTSGTAEGTNFETLTREENMTDCGYTTRDNSEAYVTDELYNVPLFSLPEDSLHPASLAGVLQEGKLQVLSDMSMLALDESDKDLYDISSNEVTELVAGQSEDSGSTLTEYKSQFFPESCQYRLLSSEDDGRSMEQGRYTSEASDVTNVPLPVTPTASPQPDHTLQIQASKVALALEQYKQGAGILWDCVRQLLERDRLHPADLTESEFIDLVCCDESETIEWLEKNILRIINRSVIKFMNSRQRLMDAGIDSPSRDDAFVYAFEYMSDEEQESALYIYQKFQLQEVARVQNIHLTQDDEMAFMSLPVTARTSFIKTYLDAANEGKYLIDPSIWCQQGKEKTPQEPEEKSEIQAIPSELEVQHGAWINEALEISAGAKAPPLPPRPLSFDSTITFEHVECVQEPAPACPAIKFGSFSSPEAEVVAEEVQTSRDCNLRRSPAKSRVGLAHQYRALESCPQPANKLVVTEIPKGCSEAKRDTTNMSGYPASIDSDSATDLEPDQFTVTPLVSALKQANSGGVQRTSSQHSQKSVTKVLDVPTPIKALPTPRKACEFPRPLTPIPDTSPYQRRSVHFDLSSASTASIDTVMLGISSPLERVSRVEPSPLYYSLNRVNDSLDSLYSVFDAKFNAYVDDDETDFADDTTAVDSRKSSNATSSEPSSRRQRLKLKLRRVLSTAAMRIKPVAEEEDETQAEDERIKDLFKKQGGLKNKVSTIWGSMSLRSGSKRSGATISRR